MTTSWRTCRELYGCDGTKCDDPKVLAAKARHEREQLERDAALTDDEGEK